MRKVYDLLGVECGFASIKCVEGGMTAEEVDKEVDDMIDCKLPRVTDVENVGIIQGDGGKHAKNC